MFRYSIIGFLFLSMLCGHAQKKKQTTFDRLCDSADKYELIDYDLAYYYSRMALENKDADFSYEDIISLNTIFDTYYQKKNLLDSAFSVNKQSLKLATEHKDTVLMAYSLNNMAGVYDLSGNHRAAIVMYKKALYFLEKKKILKQIGNTCYNMSIPYGDLNMRDSALYFTNKAFKIYQEINDHSGLASCYDFYGTRANENGNYPEAIRFYKLEVLNYRQEHETGSLIIPYENMATTYLKQKDFDHCKKYLDSAMNLSVALGSKMDIYSVSSSLADYYEQIGDYKKANFYMKRYYEGKDTMSSDQLATELSDMKSNFDRENSENQIKIQTLEAERNLKARDAIKWVLIASSVFFIIVIILFINRYRIKQRSYLKLSAYQNQLLIQKEKIESTQKEIIDSITYAQRIQSAIMAKEEDILAYFPGSFLLYRPKDIVAGDFYFFEVTDTHVFYAAADCTGHGVPGALVSVVCSNALTRCVKEFNLSEPGKILDKARELVLETFNKSGKEVKDGMDISLCQFAIANLKAPADKIPVQWAGANNPLWCMSDRKLLEIKGDKQSIGHSESPKPFTTHHLTFKKQDVLYLFTDGYADQFGGSRGKKFKYKQLEERLRLISDKPLSEQKTILEQEFIAWKGMLEQVDDVLVLGLRL